VGLDEKIALDDRFAMASCTKRMTAAMIARVVDSGRLAFETTLAEVLPNMPIRDEYRGVTAAQLLTFQGGIRPYLNIADFNAPALQNLQGSAHEQREQFARHVLQEEPVAKPGTDRHYSNASYAVVALMAEQRTGKSWEELIVTEVFQPLGMATAGVGRPRTTERPHEPAMHNKTETGYEPESLERMDERLASRPAGAAHCSIRDFAKFAIYELNAARGKNVLLTPETAKRWQDLSQARGAPLLYPQGMKGKAGGKKKKAPDRPAPDSTARVAFFGGSNAVSSGCLGWPEENIAVVAAINAGFANDAIQAAHRAMREVARG
jgi:CubicO group peptidase (beta-lactamase class C family)